MTPDRPPLDRVVVVLRRAPTEPRPCHARWPEARRAPAVPPVRARLAADLLAGYGEARPRGFPAKTIYGPGCTGTSGGASTKQSLSLSHSRQRYRRADHADRVAARHRRAGRRPPQSAQVPSEQGSTQAPPLHVWKVGQPVQVPPQPSSAPHVLPVQSGVQQPPWSRPGRQCRRPRRRRRCTSGRRRSRRSLG